MFSNFFYHSRRYHHLNFFVDHATMYCPIASYHRLDYFITPLPCLKSIIIRRLFLSDIDYDILSSRKYKKFILLSFRFNSDILEGKSYFLKNRPSVIIIILRLPLYFSMCWILSFFYLLHLPVKYFIHLKISVIGIFIFYRGQLALKYIKYTGYPSNEVSTYKYKVYW